MSVKRLKRYSKKLVSEPYRRVLVCEGVVERHVLKVGTDVSAIKVLNDVEVEAGIHKNSPDVRLNYVGQTLI